MTLWFVMLTHWHNNTFDLICSTNKGVQDALAWCWHKLSILAQSTPMECVA